MSKQTMTDDEIGFLWRLNRGNVSYSNVIQFARAIINACEVLSEQSDIKDAARYRKLHSFIYGERNMHTGKQAFHINLEPVGNIMQGAVCQHFDAAIDAVLKCEPPSEKSSPLNEYDEKGYNACFEVDQCSKWPKCGCPHEMECVDPRPSSACNVTRR